MCLLISIDSRYGLAVIRLNWTGSRHRRVRRRVSTTCAVVVATLANVIAVLPASGSVRPAPALGAGSHVVAIGVPTAHQLVTRAAHSISRTVSLLGDVGMFWLGMALSALVFLMVAAVSSAVDTRMFRLGEERPRMLYRYLGHGIQTFFRILVDRRTPYSARISLVLGLLYWLLPSDLIADTTLLPGFVDDVLVAVAAAKGFVYLCPPALVAGHAAAVESHARA